MRNQAQALMQSYWTGDIDLMQVHADPYYPPSPLRRGVVAATYTTTIALALYGLYAIICGA